MIVAKLIRSTILNNLQEKGVIDEVGRYLAKKWNKEHGVDSGASPKENPWT